MIRIDMIRQDTRHPDRRRRRFEAQGPAPVYKLATLLWLHGHGGADFEAWDDLSPFGKPGGLAMRGKVRNWASVETPKGAPMFRMKSKADPDFTPEEKAAVAQAAGVIVTCDAVSRWTFPPGRATSPSGGPTYPQEGDGPSTALVTAHPEAA